MSETLTDIEVTILQAARGILQREGRPAPDEYGPARAAILAGCADEAIAAFIRTAAIWNGNPAARAAIYPDETTQVEA